MTAPEQPPVKKYVTTPPTAHELEWAELDVVDLSKMATPEGRAELVEVVRRAMTTKGFFFVVGHGSEESQTDRMHDVAELSFLEVSQEEKAKFATNIKQTGTLEGYKLRDLENAGNSVGDQTELYNLHRDVTRKNHPDVLKPYLPEVGEFAKLNHSALDKVYRLLALGMELPEDAFSKLHEFDGDNECYLTYFKYYTRSQTEEEKEKDASLHGHKDSGTVTFFWTQPVSTLQILEADGRWTWVKNIPNAIVVNAGDMLVALSGGYYKATTHRVVQPPADQVGHTCVGILYYGLPTNDFKLVPFTESPVLQRVGVQRRFEEGNEPTAVDYWRGRNGG